MHELASGQTSFDKLEQSDKKRIQKSPKNVDLAFIQGALVFVLHQGAA